MGKFIKIIQKKGTESILQAVRNNDGYCICAIQHSKDSKCPCRNFREQPIGECNCGLYEKIEIEQN